MNTAGPRSLRDSDEVADRRAMLHSSSTASPLTDWLDRLIAARESAGLPAEMPYVDPLDAGIEARVLIVLEAPGPMTNAFNALPGSGFISSDNDDATAENLWLARQHAGLIDGVVIWNAVPWYLGPTKRKPLVADKEAGGAILRDLTQMLPELHTVVPLGDHARATWKRFARPRLGTAMRTIESYHSGNQAMNQPGLRAHLQASLIRAAVDWRPHANVYNATIVIERDGFGTPTNHWYRDAHGDRIDIHPRWW
ncbi:uracil-DNA glycosylase [Micromonospora sp. DT81.3]|uniref:uracil-DNA glycosylase n=1 Tax=Micromonospora sp. DT81.3 TaxID=3416523 RepID=UPI003CE6ABD3